MPKIVVAPLPKIAEMAVRHGACEMISLLAEDHAFHRPAVISPDRHLLVGVNDINFAGKEGLVAPADIHVDAIIRFAKGWDTKKPLLVHCWMGVSRSPAAALIVALAQSPALDDGILAQALRAASPQATPNSRLIEIADRLMGRNGRLVEAVRAIGRGADYVGDAPFLLRW